MWTLLFSGVTLEEVARGLARARLSRTSRGGTPAEMRMPPTCSIEAKSNQIPRTWWLIIKNLCEYGSPEKRSLLPILSASHSLPDSGTFLEKIERVQQVTKVKFPPVRQIGSLDVKK